MKNLSFAIEPWIIGTIVGGIVLVAAIIIVSVILAVRHKNKNSRIKIDESFITSLFEILGGKENIKEVTVDNGRLKFNVLDLDVVKLDDLKRISTSGVFVTGNNIKTLFKLDSFDIKKAIDKSL